MLEFPFTCPSKSTILSSNQHTSHLPLSLDLPQCCPTTVSYSRLGSWGWAPPARIPWLVGRSISGTAHTKASAQHPHTEHHSPILPWAELSCNHDTSKRVQAPLLDSRAGQTDFVTGAVNVHAWGPWQLQQFKGHSSTSSPYPAWPSQEIYGGATPRMDVVFGLFLHHPHCPSDDSRCPCGHQKSLAGEITVHLHFSPRETRTSSTTDSRAAVTSTQMGVNTMQPASDLQIIT